MAENDNKNKKTALIIVLLLLLGLGGGGIALFKSGLLGGSSSHSGETTESNKSSDFDEIAASDFDALSPEQRRENTLRLAKYYIAHAEYEHAMELLDEMLIDNPDDEEVKQLIDDVLLLKKGALLSEFPQYLPYLEDANGDLAALARANESIRNAKKEQARAQAQERMQAAVDEIAEIRRLEQERQQRRSEGGSSVDDYTLDDRTKSAIDQALSTVKNAAATADADSVISQFDALKESLPSGNTPEENAYAAQKLSEMAQALLDRAARETDPVKKAELLAKAKEYADEAARRDPTNKTAQSLSERAGNESAAANAEQRKSADTATENAKKILENASADTSVEDILKAFDEAYRSLPKGDNPSDNAYAAQKLTEMAQALLDRAASETDPVKKAELLAKAKEYADEAARRDPTNKTAQSLSQQTGRAAENAKAEQQKATNTALSEALSKAESGKASSDDVLSAMDDVYKTLPKSDNPEANAYAAQKLSEMAQALLDRAARETDPAKKADLLAKAKEYADEAARRDPTNKTAQSLSEKLESESNAARAQAQKTADSAVSDAIKNAASGKSADDALAAMEDAYNAIPKSDNPEDNAYASQKLTEMAQALFDRAQKEKDPLKKFELLSKAKEYADEATKRDPQNQKALNLSLAITKALEAARSGQQKATDEAVSDAVKNARNAESADEALSAMDEAYKALPKGDNPRDNAYAAQKLNEMAQALLERAEKETDPVKKAELLAKAKEYADEAARRDPNNQTAKTLAQNAENAANSTRAQAQKATDSAVNDAIKNATAGNQSVDEILKSFDEAYKQLPKGDNPADNAYASQKLTEMAQALSRLAEKETDPINKAKLLSKAQEYADEAARRDPNNKQAQSLSESVQKAADSARAGQQKATDLAVDNAVKNAQSARSADEALKAMDEAYKALPQGDNPEDNAYAAQKLNEMAQALYERAQKETDPAKKAELLAKAKEYADEAARRDPNNKKSQELSKSVGDAADSARASQRKISDKAVEDAKKTAAGRNATDAVLNAAENAKNTLPTSDNKEDNAYASQKLTELAQALYDRAQKEGKAADKMRLLNKAKEYADEAVRRDSSNKQAKDLQKKIQDALSQVRAQNRQTTDAAVNKAKSTAAGKSSKDAVLKAMDDAHETIPSAEQSEENEYASEKLTEMAQSLLDRAQKENDPSTQMDLLSKADDYAEEALSRAPENAKAQEVQEAIRKATEIARDKQRRIADLAISKAKTAASSDDMLKSFEEAYKQLPKGNTPAENAEAAKKLTEMSQALIAQAEKESDPAKKTALLAKAKEYAEEAARRDPQNAQAKAALENANKAEKAAVAEQKKNTADAQKLVETARSEYTASQRENDAEKKMELLQNAKSHIAEALRLDGTNAQAKQLQQQIERALTAAESEKTRQDAQKAQQRKAADTAVSDAQKKAQNASVEDTIKAMEEARKRLPSGNTPEENAYAAQKLTEMAQALLDRAARETDPVKKAELLAKAKEYADEAARRDPNNAQAKQIAQNAGKASNEAQAEKAKAEAEKQAAENKKAAADLASSSQSLYDSALSAKTPAEKAQLLQKAKEAARAAVEKDPTNADAQFLLGVTSAETHDYKTAEDALTKATKLAPDNSQYFYELGKVKFALRKYQEAIASFDQAVKLNPKFANAQYNKGVAYERLGKIDDALESYMLAYSINPQYEKAYVSAGAMLYQQKSYAQAADAYKKAVALDPSDKAAMQGLGSVYAAEEKYSDAEQCFRAAMKLLSANEKDPVTSYNLSTVLYAQDKKTDALQYAKSAYDTMGDLKDAKMKASIAYNYALNCQDANLKEQAQKLYLEAIALDSSNVNARVNLGILYIETGNLTDSEKLLLSVYQSDSSNFEACNNLGTVYREKKDYLQAIKFYQNALRLQPKNDAVRANLAATYASAGQYKNARAAYIDVLKQNDNNYQAYIELAKVCISLEDTASAAGYLQALKAKNPQYKTAEVDSLLSGL